MRKQNTRTKDAEPANATDLDLFPSSCFFLCLLPFVCVLVVVVIIIIIFHVIFATHSREQALATQKRRRKSVCYFLSFHFSYFSCLKCSLPLQFLPFSMCVCAEEYAFFVQCFPFRLFYDYIFCVCSLCDGSVV